MKALVYHGPGRRAWEERPRPVIREPSDAIVRLTTSTICGTDLHILKGDVPTVTDGRILGHEGIGVVEDVGSAVSSIRAGDRVLISCITSCGKCDFCKKGMYLALPFRRLDTGKHHRWNAGGVCTDSARRHQSLPFRRRRRRRSARHAERHLADRIRVRCLERPGAARRYRGDCRSGTDRIGCLADGAVLLSGIGSDDRRR